MSELQTRCSSENHVMSDVTCNVYRQSHSLMCVMYIYCASLKIQYKSKIYWSVTGSIARGFQVVLKTGMWLYSV